MRVGNVKWVRLGEYIEQFRQKCANNDAIVTVNRKFGTKECGFIIDYIGQRAVEQIDEHSERT